MSTASVPRPHEHGPDQTTDLHPENDYNIIASDFICLSRRLSS